MNKLINPILKRFDELGFILFDIGKSCGCETCQQGCGEITINDLEDIKKFLKTELEDLIEKVRDDEVKKIIEWLKISPKYAKDGEYDKLDKWIIIDMLQSSLKKNKQR